MGAVYLWKCTKCECLVKTSGPWEFYRDKVGRRKKCPTLFIDGDDAIGYGVSGLSAEMYCSTCDKIANRIIVEYQVPIRKEGAKLISPKPKEKYLKADAVKCRNCGNTRLLLGDDKTIEVTCPRCKVGHLQGYLIMDIS